MESSLITLRQAKRQTSIYFLDQCVKLVYQERDLKGFYTLGHSSDGPPDVAQMAYKSV